jgi:hypothetical protein
MSSIFGYTLTGDLIGTNTFSNRPDQNVLVTQTQVKTLSASNKLLIYKTILKPIWTYGIQLWGTASTSNIEIPERFQYKALRMIVVAPWYVLSTLLHATVYMFLHNLLNVLLQIKWDFKIKYLAFSMDTVAWISDCCFYIVVREHAMCR